MSERTLVAEALSESEQPSSDGARPIRTLEETGEIVGMTPAGVWKLEQRAQRPLRLILSETEEKTLTPVGSAEPAPSVESRLCIAIVQTLEAEAASEDRSRCAQLAKVREALWDALLILREGTQTGSKPSDLFGELRVLRSILAGRSDRASQAAFWRTTAALTELAAVPESRKVEGAAAPSHQIVLQFAQIAEAA